MTPITPIINLVADYYQFPPKDLMKTRGKQPLVNARFMAVWLIREHLKLKWQEITRLMNQKHHGSMMHAHRWINEQMKTNQRLRYEAELLLRRCRGEEAKKVV